MPITNLSSRLEAEREKLGLKLQEVATQMGFPNYQTLRSIELGEREIKAWELSKLARIYHRDFSYFLEGPINAEVVNPRIIWRAQSAKTPLVEQKFLRFIENYEKIEKMVCVKKDKFKPIQWDDKEKNDFYQYPYRKIEDLALNHQRLLNLGGRPAYILPKILEESLTVKIFYWNLGDAGSGASTIHDIFGPAILINAGDSTWRRHYNIAHEFFHLLTWSIFTDEEIYDKNEGKSKVEQWADAFASALLMPSEEIRAKFNKRHTKDGIAFFDLVELSQEFEVSTEALLWRLVNLNILKRTSVQTALQEGLLQQIDRQKRNETGKKDIEPDTSPRFINLAIKAFSMGRISKAKLAEYLEIPFSEASSFLKKRGYDENKDYTREFSVT
ncbi:MAG: XRE family transcriptional regulator [Planctomycetota bacterium]